MTLIGTVYTVTVTILALYGVYALVLIVQYGRHRLRHHPLPQVALPGCDASLPAVTVQAPMYNERYVAERCIDALAALDWPRDRLHIQILDDSTDDTTAIARAQIEHYRRRGVDITLIHRSSRAGYKAGALANGLALARGEFVAVFDADFAPAPDFLRRVMPHFIGRDSVGFVQARWEHLNYSCSTLARALSLMVDGHFVVEQFARNRSDWPMIFNGSAGVWRRACLESSGGWQADTLCEDMDLSYRAALTGWRCVFVPEVAVPQEEPASIGAFKSQHARWAKGGAQCLRKHAVSILASPRWSPAQKLLGLAYLVGYTMHVGVMLVVLLWLPLAFDGQTLRQLPLTFLGLTGLALPIEFVLAQWSLHRHDGTWLRRLAYLPLLLVIGFGVAFNNALAVLAGLFTRGGEFDRTPKIAAGGVGANGYASRGEIQAWFEIAVALYALVAAVAMWSRGNVSAAVFMLFYVAGLGSVGAGSLIEALRAARAQAEMHPARARGADGVIHYE